jgi:2,3-bisphosphoglycerate-dependent phosphoglycerate mutase
MPTLVLLRHGQSQWNLENRFTGWVDVDLTAEGEAQARKGGELIKAAGIDTRRGLHLGPDPRHPHLQSGAGRGQAELRAGDQGLAAERAPLRRPDGSEQGRDRRQARRGAGDDLASLVRRAAARTGPGGEYDFSKDRRYAGKALPSTESLATTLVRVLPYWEADIAPKLASGETMLVAAHGNSLRAIVKHLFNVADAEIVHVEIPTGNPLVIDLDAGLKPVAVRYLDESRAEKLPPIA